MLLIPPYISIVHCRYKLHELIACNFSCTQFSDTRSPDVPSPTSPTPFPFSSLSSYNSNIHASMEQLQSIDLNVNEKSNFNEVENFRPPSATGKLPPAIASFMSRVRRSSTEPGDNSDGALSPPPGEIVEQKEQMHISKVPRTNSAENKRGERALSPLATEPPLCKDSPGLVRMQMSPTSKVSPQSLDDHSPSNDDTLKRTNNTYTQWIDDDSYIDTTTPEAVQSPNSEAVQSSSVITSSRAHPSTSCYSSDASVTITTSGGSEAVIYDTPKVARKKHEEATVVYDTPKAARKKYESNVVHPEAAPEPNTQSLFIDSNKSKGLLKNAQRNADPVKEQKKLSNTWDANYLDEPEIKQISYPNSHQRRSTEPTVQQGTTTYHRVPSPSTPLTPLSQHTQSDVAPHTFTYPSKPNIPSAQTNDGQFPQAQKHFTSSSGGLNTRPETGQSISYNQANPRSRNYRPQSQGGHVGADVRRTQTFSAGHGESGRSYRYQQDGPRQTVSPISDDSLPNSPTYFITNNPNDDRDTPSPATQVIVYNYIYILYVCVCGFTKLLITGNKSNVFNT